MIGLGRLCKTGSAIYVGESGNSERAYGTQMSGFSVTSERKPREVAY